MYILCFAYEVWRNDRVIQHLQTSAEDDPTFLRTHEYQTAVSINYSVYPQIRHGSGACTSPQNEFMASNRAYQICCKVLKHPLPLKIFRLDRCLGYMGNSTLTYGTICPFSIIKDYLPLSKPFFRSIYQFWEKSPWPTGHFSAKKCPVVDRPFSQNW